MNHRWYINIVGKETVIWRCRNCGENVRRPRGFGTPDRSFLTKGICNGRQETPAVPGEPEHQAQEGLRGTEAQGLQQDQVGPDLQRQGADSESDPGREADRPPWVKRLEAGNEESEQDQVRQEDHRKKGSWIWRALTNEYFQTWVAATSFVFIGLILGSDWLDRMDVLPMLGVLVVMLAWSQAAHMLFEAVYRRKYRKPEYFLHVQSQQRIADDDWRLDKDALYRQPFKGDVLQINPWRRIVIYQKRNPNT